jgi:hypothetical protein
MSTSGPAGAAISPIARTSIWSFWICTSRK